MTDCSCYGRCAHERGLDPVTVEITASEPRETETERMVKRCNRDIRRAVEEGRLEVETPRGSVEQDALQSLAVHLRYPTETIWPRGSPETSARSDERASMVAPTGATTTTGPPLLGLEFGLSINHEGVTKDLTSFDSDVIVYGDQHIWRLADPWSGDVGLRGMTVGEEAIYEHDHEWATAEEIDWRY